MRRNKLIAILVLCVFLFGTATTGAFATKGQPSIDITVGNDGSVQMSMKFKDMNEAKWALKHVLKMNAEEIIKGYEDGSFRPNKPVTHEEAVVLTMLAAGLKDEISQTVTDSVYLPFKDAGRIQSWAKKAVIVAVKKGYLDASPSGNFQPNKPASREWVTKLIAKALGLQPVSVQLPFKDADKISSDAAGYVAAVVYNQLISGFPDGTFQPNKPITRAEIAVMLGLSTSELPIPGKVRSKVEGTIVSVSKEVYQDVGSSTYGYSPQGTITLNIKGDDDEDEDEDEGDVNTSGTVTYPVAKDALIYVDGQSAALGDLAVGAKAEAVVDGNGMITYIEVEPVIVKGVVQSVYAAENKLTILQGWENKHARRYFDPVGVPVTYTAADGVTVVINGVSVQLASLLPGDVVKLTLNAGQEVTGIKASRFIKDEDKDKGDDRDGQKGKDEKNGQRNNHGKNQKQEKDDNVDQYEN